ncbi:MAG: fasciclin domain-containing protein [Roseinatronobacter sp.]|uniref:Putative surface protein with fasciclin (FAS1) repeats n=1 Tax=Roseinatronobacter monicus TaxID=393481 RepID=A0A543K8S3_9RHOB|nr:fasciclin domain-containing protein [Roseinatronobacter monicus]TQM91467.1 putative surface protein with fasciclin (FAS1) repeats [Roseinatronobacter monicus]TVP98306.1 MAG: fasciclin domain-containing protein [Roseinatronobacter sp.]
MFRTTLSAMAMAGAVAMPSFALADSHEQPGDIIDIAAGNEAFSTLVAAITAAGLVETLQGEGPFTVFAPTDEAFAALPEGTVEALLDDIPALTAILTYHVVPGAVMSGDLEDGMMAETVNGASVTIGVGDTVTVDGATVTQADIEASNGVIHVIDAVILPE